MNWPDRVFISHYDSETNTYTSEERPPTPPEQVLIGLTSPVWGLVSLGCWIGDNINNWNEQQKAQEAERQATEAKEAEERDAYLAEITLAEELRAKQDNDIFKRTNQLLALDIGGCIATISRRYPRYTSTWHYRVTKNNHIIRTRNGDDATVIFSNSTEMMEDLQRYRWANFELV